MLNGSWGGIAARKQAAVGQLTRQMTGDLMKQAFTQIKGPDYWQELEIAFRSTDPATIAERWITHSMMVADANGDQVTAFADIMKPHNIGAETRVFRGQGGGVRWHHVAEILHRTEEGADEVLLADLKAGYRLAEDAMPLADNAISRDAWFRMTDDAGLDRGFAERSYKMATGPEVDEFYKGYRKAFTARKGIAGKARDETVAAARQLNRVRARVMGLSEEEYVKLHFAAPPELLTQSEAEAIAGADALLEMTDNASLQIRQKTFVTGHNIDQLTEKLGTSLAPERAVKETYKTRAGTALWTRGEGGVNRSVMAELPDADAAEHYFDAIAATDRQRIVDLIPTLPKADQTHAIKALAKADAIRSRTRYVFQDPDGRSYYLGGVTAQDLVVMARDVMPQHEGLAAKDWYTNLRDGLVRTFGPTNAPTVLRMFSVSQANDSPVNGLMLVMRAFEQSFTQGFDVGKIGQREFLTVVGRKLKDMDAPLGLQLNAENIVKAMLDMPVDRGFAAKLNDFMDSVLGNTSRRWIGRADDGLMPVAVDRHTARDIGLMDQKVINHLAELPYAEKLKNGVVVLKDSTGAEIATVKLEKVFLPKQPGKFEERWHLVDRAGNYVRRGGTESEKAVMAGDLTSKPDEAQYEHGVGPINEAARLFNEQAVWGRTDWTPSEVQAVGWMRVQKTLGGMEESPVDTLSSSTYHVPIAVEPALGSDLGNYGRVLANMDSASRARATATVLTDMSQSITAEWGMANVVADNAAHADTLLPVYGPPAHQWTPQGWSRGRHVSLDEAAALRARGARIMADAAGAKSSIEPMVSNWNAVVDDLHSAVQPAWGGATFNPRTGARITPAEGRFVSAVGNTVSLTPAEARDPRKYRAALERFVDANREALQQDRHVIGVFHDEELGRVDIDLAVLTHELEDAEGIQLALQRPGGAYDFDTGNGVYAPVVKHAGAIRPVSWLSTEQAAMDFADRASVSSRSIVKVPLRRPTGQFNPATHRPVISITMQGVDDVQAAEQRLLRLINAARQDEISSTRLGKFDWAISADANGRPTLQIIDDAPPGTAFFERHATDGRVADRAVKAGMLDADALDQRLTRWEELAGVGSTDTDLFHGPLYEAGPPKVDGAYDWSTQAHVDDTVKRLRDRGRTDVSADDVVRWRDEYARSLDGAVREADPGSASAAVPRRDVSRPDQPGRRGQDPARHRGPRLERLEQVRQLCGAAQRPAWPVPRPGVHRVQPDPRRQERDPRPGRRDLGRLPDHPDLPRAGWWRPRRPAEPALAARLEGHVGHEPRRLRRDPRCRPRQQRERLPLRPDRPDQDHLTGEGPARLSPPPFSSTEVAGCALRSADPGRAPGARGPGHSGSRAHDPGPRRAQRLHQ
jgi:hypothetical protein